MGWLAVTESETSWRPQAEQPNVGQVKISTQPEALGEKSSVHHEWMMAPTTDTPEEPNGTQTRARAHHADAVTVKGAGGSSSAHRAASASCAPEVS